jgi:hypothetical protein
MKNSYEAKNNLLEHSRVFTKEGFINEKNEI